jgi:hypothetical protein
MKILATAILASAGLLALAIPAATVTQPPAKTTTAKPAAARSTWAPEDLSGTITTVDPRAKLLAVDGPDGVPFDMMVTRKTHILSGSQAVTLQDLEGYRNTKGTIRFVPMRRGDVAESIRIGG